MENFDQILKSQPIILRKGVISVLRVFRVSNPPHNKLILLSKKPLSQKNQEKSIPVPSNPDGNFSWIA